MAMRWVVDCRDIMLQKLGGRKKEEKVIRVAFSTTGSCRRNILAVALLSYSYHLDTAHGDTAGSLRVYTEDHTVALKRDGRPSGREKNCFTLTIESSTSGRTSLPPVSGHRLQH
jgi:hypothetical protein